MRFIILSIFLLISHGKVFSQIQNSSSNLKPKRILFTYVQVPNFYFEKNKVYADSITLSNEFPNVKINFSKSPLDSTTVIAYVNKIDISAKNIKDFRSKVFHSFTVINYEYKVKSKTVEYYGSICKSDLCKKTFREFFDERNIAGTDIFESSITFYEGKQIIIFDSSYSSNQISYKDKSIIWSDQFSDVGTYYYTVSIGKKEMKKKSIIYVDSSLDKHISPTTLFNNCDYGVKEIRNDFSTSVLSRVEYKY